MTDLVVEQQSLFEGLDRAVVEARAAGEPAWLRERRLAAWETFEATPLPTTKLEEWRYTDISQLALDEVRPSERPGYGETMRTPAGARTLIAGEKRAAARVLQVGTPVVAVELSDALKAKGVLVMELGAAAREHGDLVREHLGTRAVPAAAGKFPALNGALWEAGIFVYVPPGVHVELPIRAGHWLDESGVAVFPRTLIIAGQGSRLAYVDEFASPDFDAPALSCGAAEVIAGADAEVQYVALQRWGRGVRHLSFQRTVAQRNAGLDSLVVNLGATVARVDMSASLEGPGARSDMLGLYFADRDQHFDHNTRQDHVAPNANSDLLYKGALYDRARAVFRGIIKVHPGAQGTDAYQTNRNLLLSEEARADSLPNLEIQADDVRCSHGATVGQLDHEELFYLMSRGLPRRQAERLVIFGFLGEVLDRLPLPGVVDELRAAIEAKLAS